MSAFNAIKALAKTVKPDILVYELNFIRSSITNIAGKLRYKSNAVMENGQVSVKNVKLFPCERLNILICISQCFLCKIDYFLLDN